jgi:hypothetical protein
MPRPPELAVVFAVREELKWAFGRPLIERYREDAVFGAPLSLRRMEPEHLIPQ